MVSPVAQSRQSVAILPNAMCKAARMSNQDQAPNTMHAASVACQCLLVTHPLSTWSVGMLAQRKGLYLLGV